MAEKLQRSLIDAAQRQEMQGQPVILLVAGPVRACCRGLDAWQYRFARFGLSGNSDNKQVTIVATVGPTVRVVGYAS